MKLKLPRFQKVIALAMLVLLGLTMAIGVIPPGSANAEGETFTWSGYNKITVTGGGISQESVLEIFGNTLPGKPQVAGGRIYTTGKNKDKTYKCYANADLKLDAGGGKGVLYITIGGIGSHTDIPECPEGVSNTYNNRDVSVGGTRPTDPGNDAETPQQQRVYIKIKTTDPPEKAPPGIFFDINDASGVPVASIGLSKNVVDDKGYAYPDALNVYYDGDVHLPPGAYTATASAYLAAPVTFTKEKYKDLSLEYGTDASGRSIEVTINYNIKGQGGSGAEHYEVGPQTIELQKPDGTVIATTTTAPVKGDFPKNSGGNIANTIVFLHAKFENIPAGTYKVCFGEGHCNEVIKVDGQNATTTLDGGVLPDDKTDPNANPAFSCENKIGLSDVGNVFILNPLPAIGKGINWLVCTIIRAVNGAINFFDQAVLHELEFPSSNLEGDKSNPKDARNGYYQAWSAFRYLAVGLLVLVGLIMVISQMVGIGIFDAYTVKKLLPRIFAAAILITLSWSLCKIMIDIFNILGGAVRGLIYAPFGGAGNIADGISNAIQGNTAANSTAFAGAAIGGFFLVATTNFLVILSFALPALVAVLIGFFFIVMRQVAIILMVLVAPLAIVSFILPGTERGWKFWRENFFRALLMYPLIVAFLSIGRVFAYVIVSQGTSGVLNSIIALIAYFGPYFAIPATFKLAGGILSTVAGVANDRSRGLLDRNRKMRQGQQKKTWADTRAGNRFKGTGALSTKASGFMGYGSNMNNAGFNPLHMKSRMRTALQERNESGIKDLMESSHFKQWSGDDAKVSAAQFTKQQDIENELARFDAGRFAGEANRARRQEAAEQIMRSQRHANSETFARARVRAQSKTGTGYQYKDQNGNTQVDYSRMIDDINEAYGSDRNGAGQALAEMRNNLAQSGHVAGLAGYGTWSKAMEDRYSDVRRAGGLTAAEDEQSRFTAHNRIMDNAIDSVGPGQAIYGKPSSAGEIGLAHARRLQAQSNRINDIAAGVHAGTNTVEELTGAKRLFEQDLASVMSIHDAASQASPQNGRAIADQLMNVQVANPETGQVMSVYDLGNDPTTMGRDGYAQMRRDLTGRALRDAQGRMTAPQNPTGGPPTPGQPGFHPPY